MTWLILGRFDGLVPSGVRVGRFAERGPDATAWFDAEIASAVVGWRGVLVGREGDVLHYRARAVSAGAEPDEITTIITSAGGVDVYCARCGEVGPGSPCAACGAELVVEQHVSSVLAARLGVPGER